MNTSHLARAARVLCLAAVALSAFAALAATPAAAHECAFYEHIPCNGHDCPDDGDVHHHTSWHTTKFDHWCWSEPTPGGVVVTLSGFVDPLGALRTW